MDMGFRLCGSLAIKSNMAALVAMLMKKVRHGSTAVSQRKISSVKCMPELENNLMNFVLPFSLANLTQDKKTISREYTRSKKLKKTSRSWSARKDFESVRTPFIPFLE